MGANRTENKQINFRVSEEEYQRLKKIADNFGMSVGAYCKERSKGSKLVAPKIDREGALNIATELRKIGTNINQIAKYVNIDKNANLGQINGIQRELNNIWQLLSSGLQK